MESFFGTQRLLVIAPHADDEVIGSGGLMARVRAEGGEVYVLVLTVGDLKHYDGGSGMTEAARRLGELEAAMRCLDVNDYEVVYEDNHKHLRLDEMPRRDLVDILERTARLSLDRLKPTIVSIPAPSYNQDHEAVFNAALTACRPHLPSLKPFQRLVLVADAPQLCWGSYHFKPNFYVDISAYLDKKLEAFKCHLSQQRPDPHNGGVESLRLLALHRGREVSVHAAEAFECYRFVV